MKVLLDENLPQDLRHFLAGHEVATVGYLGWKGIGNGDLLVKAAASGFEVMLTQDAGILHQHDADTLPLAVVVIVSKSNKLESLRPLIPAMLRAMATLKPCMLVRVGLAV